MKKEKFNGVLIVKVSILWLFALAIVIALLMASFRNFIFATDVSNEQISATVEPNEAQVDILQLMVENNYSNKKLVNEKRNIKYDIQKKSDDQIPKGEEEVKTKGKDGELQVTALQEFNNNTYKTEEIIETKITKQPVTQVVHVGTSEFLAKYKVHIGEEMYLTEKTDLKKEAKADSETVTTFNRYLNFTILKVSGNWTKVKYENYEGFLPNEKLTSEAITPMVKEKNRIAQLQASLNKDMDLSQPSGLTLSDFKTVLGYNERDKNNIFADNVEVFYNAEQTYGINGIFLAAIGIHESAWGTSFLAKEKNNLFGYMAYDRDPINSAKDFETYEDCINTVAEAVAKNYLTPTGSYYYGTTAEAVNTKYASDKAWHAKVFSYMEYLYDKLG